MKNDSNAFESQATIASKVVQHQIAQTVAQQRIARENRKRLYIDPTIEKKKSNSFNDIYFSIYNWFSKLGETVGGAINAVTSFITEIFADDTVRLEIHEIMVKQAKMEEQINFLFKAQQDFEDGNKELREQTVYLEKKLDELERIKSSSSTHDMLTTDSPEMSMTDIPEGIVCPITQLIFKDPVTLKLRKSDGTFFHQTYERDAIIEWKNTCYINGRHFRDPVTQLLVVNDPRSAPTDEFKQEMVRQFLTRCSAKTANTTTLWQTQKYGAVAQAPIQSDVGFDVSVSPRLGSAG
ncbi:MAG: hypothetical protein WC748_10180 [Legionellales bacterium]|jgi:hypothetical protein